MFDPVVSSLLDTFSGVEDAGVVAAIGVASGEENAACARRLEAMGELYARRAPEDDDERTGWLVDGYESLAAEVAAELGISRGRARGQLRYAIHLREKLPQLMRVFVTGAIDMRMVITIVNRVVLITDGELMAQLDAKLAQWAPRWMRLSGPKLEERIDWWVERIDPAGRRVPDQQPLQRSIEIWPADSGLASIEGQLRATDGVALDKRLDALANTVCPHDPRTRDERRADALGALAAGLSELRCECDSDDCIAAQRPAGTNVVIHVLAEQGTVDGASTTPGYLSGYGPLPATTVKDFAGTAKLKPLTIPDPTTPAEPGYRPSAALAEFVRARDLTCRFPGCDQPAEVCDVDHTVPWPAGPTHPSKPVFVGLDAASSESGDAWEGFLTGLGERGLACPLLVISDGAAGLIGALEPTMGAALRQRCLVHRARNVLAKVPKNAQAQVKADYWAIFDVPDTIEPGLDAVGYAQKRIDSFEKRWREAYPAAVRCLLDDRDSLTVYLRFPREHWTRVRHSNFIERTYCLSA